MSRHRNVRSMRYSDEYDGYDDVYGHSVEEDYPMSPSDAAFFYDRNNRNPQLSSFISAEDDIKEEDDESASGIKTEIDERMKNCLIAIRTIVGNEKSDSELMSVILQANYDVQVAVNMLYTNEENLGESNPKPQRSTTDRRRGKEVKKKGPKRNPPSFNVVQFLKSQVNRKIDLLGASLIDSGSSKDARLRKVSHPLLNTRVSTVGYYLCKKAIEIPTPPLISVPMTIPHGIVPFKFDVQSPEDAPVIKKS
uniref:HBS1-like protein n=1 Tax=Lygus hesperus TaxID=30085 RepID=A0A0K8TES9_LYGHE